MTEKTKHNGQITGLERGGAGDLLTSDIRDCGNHNEPRTRKDITVIASVRKQCSTPTKEKEVPCRHLRIRALGEMECYVCLGATASLVSDLPREGQRQEAPGCTKQDPQKDRPSALSSTKTF